MLLAGTDWQVLAHPRWPADATKRFAAPPDTVRSALLSGAGLEHVRTCAASLPTGLPRSIELDAGILGCVAALIVAGKGLLPLAASLL